MNEEIARVIRNIIDRGKRARQRLARKKPVQDNGRAQNLRGRALRRGYRIHRSRFAVDPTYNFGLYMLTDEDGPVIMGTHYDASLDEIEAFLRERPLRVANL